MFRMVSALAEKDYVTLANVASGTAALVFASMFRFDYALGAIVLSVVFDFLDGFVARSGKVKTGANDLGKQLDSLCDAVSFGAAPAFAAFLSTASGTAAQNTALAAGIASLLYVCAAVVRLAHFNVQSEKGVFYGLPSPAAALIVMAGLVWLPVEWTWLVVLACAIGMVAWVRIPKPFYKGKK